MKLSIESLTAAGAFTGRPLEREVVWKRRGEELRATVYVRPLSYYSAVSDLTAAFTKTDAVAGRIAASIVDEEGNPVFTVADIMGTADPERGPLDANLTHALLGVIAEVNQAGKP